MNKKLELLKKASESTNIDETLDIMEELTLMIANEMSMNGQEAEAKNMIDEMFDARKSFMSLKEAKENLSNSPTDAFHSLKSLLKNFDENPNEVEVVFKLTKKGDGWIVAADLSHGVDIEMLTSIACSLIANMSYRTGISVTDCLSSIKINMELNGLK